jgi:hypothetical protein
MEGRRQGKTSSMVKARVNNQMERSGRHPNPLLSLMFLNRSSFYMMQREPLKKKEHEEMQHVTQRSLEEAQIQEEVQRETQRSLEEAQIHEEVQWVTQRSLEEAHACMKNYNSAHTKIFGGGSHA